MFDSPYSPDSFEPLLDSDRAAAIIRVHPKTLQRYARTGIVHGVRVGKLHDLPEGKRGRSDLTRSCIDEDVVDPRTRVETFDSWRGEVDELLIADAAFASAGNLEPHIVFL